MSALVPKWMMQDPLRVLLCQEAAALKRTCAGCANAKQVADPFGGTIARCLKGRPYGKKCKQYEVANG